MDVHNIHRFITSTTDFSKGYVQNIKKTIEIMQQAIDKEPTKLPTLNAKVYIRDVSFLLDLLEEKDNGH